MGAGVEHGIQDLLDLAHVKAVAQAAPQTTRVLAGMAMFWRHKSHVRVAYLLTE